MVRFDEKIVQWLANALPKAGMTVGAKKYFSDSVRYSVLACVFFWLFWAIFFDDLLFGICAAIVFFGLNLCFWLYVPLARKRKKAHLVERDLPFALMNLSIELGMENRFERALKNVSGKDNGVLGKEIRIALQDVASAGVSLQEALCNMSKRVDSDSLKRALMKIIAIYEHGGKRKIRSDAIRSIAKEELAIQRAKTKEFSQKLVMYSLVFIVVSAIFPALFEAFIIIGSAFMQLDFDAVQIILICTVVFPAVDLAVLFFIKSRTPYFLR